MEKLRKMFDFRSKSLSIVNKWKIWFIVPAVIILIAVIEFAIFAGIDGHFIGGFNVGLDFTGGTIMTIPFDEELSEEKFDTYFTSIEQVLTEKGIDIESSQISEESIVIRYKNDKDKTDDELSVLNDEIKIAIQQKFPSVFVGNQTKDGSFIEVEFIGASVSNELIWKAVVSISVTLVLILLYIIIRSRIGSVKFEWMSAIATIVALIHDSIMIFAFTIIFRVRINSSFVIAIVTIIAYAVNNTMVIFNRVHEEMAYYADNYSKKDLIAENPVGNKKNVDMIVNKAVTESLYRTINTTLTTLIMVGMLCIVNVETLREFSLPLLFGLLAGAFSANLIAPSLYAILKKNSLKKQIEKMGGYVATNTKAVRVGKSKLVK